MTSVAMLPAEMEYEQAVAPTVLTGPIVVATDGSDAALAAFNAAAMIARRSGAAVRVVTALEPLPLMYPSVEGMLITPDLERSREEVQRTLVRRQMARFDEDGGWSMELRSGRPAEVIVDYASEQKASLIIIGLNKHGVVGRLLGEETAMDIAQLTEIPLLVASPGMKRLPKRVLVAMDLNPDGQQCAEAIAAIADTPSISCVHVKPRSEFMGIDWAEFDSEYELAMRDRFKDCELILGEAHLRPDLVVLHGNPAYELAEFARFSKAELIAVGVKRHRGRARAIGGKTARRTLRQADCSVLIIPNTVPRTIPAIRQGTTQVLNDRKSWSTELRNFTSRNSGRVVDIEVDDPEIGAVLEASRYPLRGVDYDHKDGRLTITLGYTKGVDRHLTRSIADPESVSVMSIDGKDNAMSIRHGGGQTLLKF